MKILFLLIALLSAQASFAQTATEYVYKKDGLILERRCFEVDSETKGRKYQTEVSVSHCRPKKIEFLFKTGLIFGEGTCLIVDSETKGDLYKVYAWQLGYTKIDCAPEDVEYIYKPMLGGRQCLLVDSETKGEKFIDYVSDYYCMPERSDRLFVFERRGFHISKNCYLVDKTTRGERFREMVADINCRPEDFTHVLERHGLNLSKKCYSVDTETMGENYRSELAMDNCRDLLSSNEINDSSRQITKEQTVDILLDTAILAEPI